MFKIILIITGQSMNTVVYELWVFSVENTAI